MTGIAINTDRLLDELDSLRSIGAVSTGVVRPAFSEKDVEARLWIAGRMRAAGLEAVFDPAGNLFGLPPGDQRSTLVGSHSDTQPEGGWLDGAYGVMAGLEVARASLEGGGPPVAVVSFQDEEGRFGGLVGSSIWSGARSLAEADQLTDANGISFQEARRAIASHVSEQFVPAKRFSAFIEPHIEQGPVLDRHREVVGVVESIVGIRQVIVEFTGEQNHAGTTPMDIRRDAFQALAQLTVELNERLRPMVTPATVWTIGRVAVHPNGPSIVPGRVTFTVQWRDRSADRLEAMHKTLQNLVTDVADRCGVSVDIIAQLSVAPAMLDTRLVAGLQAAAERLVPGQWRTMTSGALHDASNLSAVLPTAMLFVPSIGGISHSFAEDTAADDLAAGAQVLAAAVEDLAGSS